MIAHRLTTIRNADLIIVLERGQMIEAGTHNDLIAQRGLYYELVTASLEKEKEGDPVNDIADNEIEKQELIQQNTGRYDALTSFLRLVILLLLVWHSLSEQPKSIADDPDDSDPDLEETTLDDSSGNKKKKRCRVPFAWKILRLNAPEWPWITMGIVCSLIYGAAQPLFALFFAQIYGLFAEPDLEEQKRLTRVYAIIIFFIGFIKGIVQLLSSVGFAKSGEELTMRMRKLTFSAMLRQEIGYFDYETNSVGVLITRLSADASSLKVITS